MRAISSKRLMLLSFALMIGFAGCASGSGGGGGGSRSSSNRLVAADMANQQELDLYQAIRQLRGRWLTSRGRGTPRVHVDGGARQGGVQELQNIRVSEVQEVEFMGAADATLRFGTGYEAGAILVTTRRR
ncbi:MAG TPA: hypothetical protein EYO97_03585 [Gemmatimonadetes bacterium]|nr:hypothetical protein [Gemmatimonadota bacterium]